MGPDLIIFDCDGVLVDSEPLSNRVLTDCLNEAGFDLSFEEVAKNFIGLTLNRCFAMLEERFGRPMPPDFEVALQERTYARFRTDLEAVPGVIDVLNSLDEDGQATCVASSGTMEKMQVSLGITGLWDRFDGRIFNSAMVTRGKPWPDLFLHAAERMGVAPENSVVIEDSLPGVQAARAAGMTVFGYVGGSLARPLAAEGAIEFDDMARLPELIRTL